MQPMQLQKTRERDAVPKVRKPRVSREQGGKVITATRDSYNAFLASKQQLDGDHGFIAQFMPDWLFDYQRHLIEWACVKGRSAIFADCGMGKTPMQLVWAENVRRETGKPVLIATPLAVSYQTVVEAERFGIEAARSGDGSVPAGIVVTNYERLHHFDQSKFGGMVCDESSILKNFDGSTKAVVTEFMRLIPYRLLCTATAAPNDYHELGTSSEALGYLGYQDMLSRFFKEDIIKDYLGWGRKAYRFRGHAEDPFWRWVCSWARACRKPSDLGFDDGRLVLPPLHEHEVVVQSSKTRPGMLFSLPAETLQEQRQERRITLEDRCGTAADLVAGHQGSAVIWCHLNDEGDLLERIIPDCRQVSGSQSEDEKEELLLAFQRGELKRLVTKPKIGCFGLNWQHCHKVVTFASHSWEQYYQAVRRCWRFGQQNAVDVHVVATEGEVGVLSNLRRKADAADRMFESLVRHMGDALAVDHKRKFPHSERIPAWLSQSK
jgi:hypothetical protein